MTFIEQKKKLYIYKFRKLIIVVCLSSFAIVSLLLWIHFDGSLENLFLNIFGGVLTGAIITGWSIINEFYKRKICEKYNELTTKIKELNIPVFDMDLEEYQEFCLDEYEQDISKFEYITDIYGNFVNKRNEYEQFCTDLRKLINDGSADELALTFETLIYKVYSELSDYYIDTYWYAPDSEVISLMYSDHNDQEQCYAMDSATLLFKNNDVILDDTYELIIQNISNFIVETNNLTKVLETIKKNKLKEIRKFKV